jgi:transcriptional regulator with XRE-family HTH domain
MSWGIIQCMAIGDLIRGRRIERGLTQAALAELLCRASGSADGAPGRDAVKRWENGRIIPGPYWLGHLAKVLEVPRDVLRDEARLSRVNRRTFLTLAAATALHGAAASDLVGAIAGGDHRYLTAAQTTHEADLVTASLADHRTLRYLRSWSDGGDTAVLRVNAAGVLDHDAEVRTLYLTAVAHRACALPWDTAAALVADPETAGARASGYVAHLVKELSNPRDAGARWCAGHLLRELSPHLGGTL